MRTIQESLDTKDVEQMYYAAIGTIAILILVIENYDLLLGRSKTERQPVWKDYRYFLWAVFVYYTTDVLWGIIESQKLAVLLYIDTSLYFIAMACGVLAWTKFTVTYLGETHRYGRFLLYAGRVFAAGEILLVFLNIATPILFSVDAQCVYRAHPFRYVLLSTQILLLLLNAAHAFDSIARGKRTASKNRYLAIAFFGIIMAAFLTIQLWYPYLPVYSVAYMLGTCLLQTFVINNEKEEYKSELEEALIREKQQYKELINARVLAYKDALTGVKSKLAYLEYEEKYNSAIQGGREPAFAVGVFDVNGLKEVNDTLGHEQGDKFLIDACMIICRHFTHSPVFRIGGDEFVVLLEREDYDNRAELTRSFDDMMENPKTSDQIIIAMGVSEYDAVQDDAFNDVFIRADQLMYERKRAMKMGR